MSPHCIMQNRLPFSQFLTTSYMALDSADRPEQDLGSPLPAFVFLCIVCAILLLDLCLRRWPRLEAFLKFGKCRMCSMGTARAASVGFPYMNMNALSLIERSPVSSSAYSLSVLLPSRDTPQRCVRMLFFLLKPPTDALPSSF